jgi:tRNA-uridine 2-sulfurtransferase
MARVVLAMSGGVDSSVAAHLLVEAGHEVIGVFMRHGEESAEVCKADSKSVSPILPILQGRLDHKQGCCSASDAADARRVADRLDIPFYALDLQSDFRRIVDYFVDEYQHGRTPNPCVQCNNWIKFGKLFDYADAVGAEFVATGHYARMEKCDDPDNPIGLFRGVDDHKDQAYVLAGIDRRYLPRMMLPIGDFHKPQIRALAAQVGLRVADKRDSQEICFVTSGKHAEFVRQRSSSTRSGSIETMDGTVVGTHEGIEQFTIGQRKGVRVAMGEPYFVVRIEPETNRVVIGRQKDLERSWLVAEGSNWLLPPDRWPASGLSVKIRYNSSPQPAQVQANDEGQFRVTFDQPCLGIAPGQLAVVFYNDRVLGGGWIRDTGT